MAFSSPLLALVCEPSTEIIRLETQLDVDNFQLNHGPCDQVENLHISGADISNLDGLLDITSVGGIYIDSNPTLTNIHGLANLTRSNTTLWIESNAILTNINGLANLTSVHDLRIEYNSTLTNIDGLAKLTNVGSNLVIRLYKKYKSD